MVLDQPLWLTYDHVLGGRILRRRRSYLSSIGAKAGCPLEMITLIMVCLLLQNSCSKNNTSGGPNDFDSTTSSSSDSQSYGTDLPEQEVLYSFPGINNIGTIEVDDQYLYFEVPAGLYRGSKTGGDDPEKIGGNLSGFVNQNLVVDDSYVYWLSGASVSKYSKQTGVTTQLAVPSEIDPAHAFTADETRLYLSSEGCETIASISKDGEDPLTCTQERTGYTAGGITLATDADHVYCTGGCAGSTAGRMYRCLKSGGPLEEVTTVPDPESAYGSQVGPTALVGDKVYYINNYCSGSYWMQRVSVAPASGGPTTILEEIAQVDGPARLHYDESRTCLYWWAAGKVDMMKYHLETKELSLVELIDVLSTYPVAADEDYLYWPTNDTIYRMHKF